MMENAQNEDDTNSINKLKQIGYKLGFEQQQLNNNANGNSKSTCCLLL